MAKARELLRPRPRRCRESAAIHGWGWELALIPICVASIGYSLWTAAGEAHVGPVTIDPLDVGLVVALALCGALWLKYGIVDRTPTTWLAAVCLVSVLLAPALIGFAQGHEWQSIFRQARVSAYYLLIVVAAQLLRDRRSAERLMLAIIGITIAAAAFAAASLVFGWHWQSRLAEVPTSYGIVSRGFGLPSALQWYCLASLFCFAYALFSDGGPGRRRAVGLAGVGLVALTAITLVRANYVALPAGLVVILLVAVAQRGGWRATARSLGWRRSVGVAGLVLIVVVGLGLAQPRDLSIFVQRAASVVESGTSSGADHNRELRVLALQMGVRSAVGAPLGVGYGWGGSGRETPSLTDDTVGYFAGLDGFAWAGIYLGVIGTVVFCIGLVVLVLRLLTGLTTGEGWWVSAAIVSGGVALVAQSLGAAVLFGNPGTYAMVPILLAVGLLPTRARTDSDAVSPRTESLPEAAAPTRRTSRIEPPHLVKVILTSSPRSWLLARVAALSGVCVVVAAAILLASGLAGHAVSLGATVYGQPPGLLFAPGIGRVDVNGTVIEQAREYWPPVPVWFIRSGGLALAAYVRVTQNGPYAITLNAYGSLADGVAPLVSLTVDNATQGKPQHVGTWPLSYVWHVSMLRGIRRVGVTYLNGVVIAGQDRNLFVESLAINSLAGSPGPQFASRAEWLARH